MLKSALVLIYNVLAHSKSVHCFKAWRNAPETHLKKAYITPKPMVRTIFDKISNFWGGLETATAALGGVRGREPVIHSRSFVTSKMQTDFCNTFFYPATLALRFE